MVPFASAIRGRAGDDLAVLRLKDRVRGWNGVAPGPGAGRPVGPRPRSGATCPACPSWSSATRWAAGSRCSSAAEPDVVGVAALAPWVESDVRQPRAGASRCCSCTARATASPTRAAPTCSPGAMPTAGVDLRYVKVEGGTHTMLKDAALWHDTVADFVTDVLLGPGRTS